MRRNLAGSLVAALAATVLVGAVLAAPASAARPTPTGITAPVTGTATNAGQAVTFAGTFTAQRFTTVGGQLAAVGTLSGTLTNTVTGATQTVSQQVVVPVSTATGSCQILDLVLGPLDLNLLGLMVHLDTVHLNITAQQGPGNLLGNLLCAVAGLLDNAGGPAGGLAGLLNQILAILG